MATNLVVMRALDAHARAFVYANRETAFSAVCAGHMQFGPSFDVLDRRCGCFRFRHVLSLRYRLLIHRGAVLIRALIRKARHVEPWAGATYEFKHRRTR